MESRSQSKSKDRLKEALAKRHDFLRHLYTLPGQKIIDRIIELEDPHKMVRELPNEDFFWLIKKIGEDECLPLLEMASEAQWQYILDLELWKKDRLDPESTAAWIKRLETADSHRLVRWMFTEGESFAFLNLSREIEVVILERKDDFQDLPEGFFSVDGVFYIRVIDPAHREIIERLIRLMAEQDYDRYQAILLGILNVLPAEMEEEMYRLRNVRLAEHGFLPREEALAVYAPLDPDRVELKKGGSAPLLSFDQDDSTPVPVSPMVHTGHGNLLAKAVSGIPDPLLQDRLRLEFAGLCNQIISADGIMNHEIDALIRACQKAARYLNLGIERLCGQEIPAAEQLLREHPLTDIFRVGFGLAVKTRWEAERWMYGSWFYGRGFRPDFWGDHWGGVLAGLLQDRPRYYVGPKEIDEYKEFEWLHELAEAIKVLHRLMVLDGLLAKLADDDQIEENTTGPGHVTFFQTLFNYWARRLLNEPPGFNGMTMDQVKTFFKKIRAGTKKPPFKMMKYREVFINDFMNHASDSDLEAKTILRDSLSLIWDMFTEEYEWVSGKDLDERYTRFVSIASPH